MPVTNGLLTHRYDENIRPGVPRLGRHLELDARSLAYTVAEAAVIKPASWDVPIPILDQGDRGSCVGHAATSHLAQLYGPDLASLRLKGNTLNADPVFDEAFALEVYHESTIKDGLPGVYPPDDTGSTGLGVCRALKSAGLIQGYTWATTLRGFASLLQRGSVLMGTVWPEAFFAPDPKGFVDWGNWEQSQIAGGHEIACIGLEAWDDRDPAKCVFLFANSWGPAWGIAGHFRMRGSTYELLKHEIDLKQMKR